MKPAPAFHPITEDKMPLPPRVGGVGIGAPLDPFTGRGVMPRMQDFDPFETRTYNGVSGAELSRHAQDLWNMFHDGPRLDGAARRGVARSKAVMAVALWAYITVKNALGLLAAPLRSASYKPRRRTTHRSGAPQAPTVWLTKPPTTSEWNARDMQAGYDIRGTSPTWVMRRVYRHRAARRRALETPHARLERHVKTQANTQARTDAFIGPPTPRHYKDVEDMGLIWPPVPRPSTPKNLLPPVEKAEFIAEGLRANLSADDIAAANALINGYNFALEQFGEDGNSNFLRGLQDLKAQFMDTYLNAFHRGMAKKREPP